MNCTKYELCEIVAIDQLEGAAAAAGEKTVSINPALMNVGTEETPVDATHIVLKSGDDAEGTTASQILITTGEVQAETYTITINADGGTGENVPVTGTFEEGAEIVLPVLTKDGYTFLGWKKDDAETVIDGSASAPTTVYATADATYTAVFEEISGGGEEPPVGDTYTVTFIGADGSTAYVTETEVASGTAITDLIPATDPTKPNSGVKKYEFVGWYSDSTLETKIDTTLTVTSNLTYYAKFVQIMLVGDVDLNGRTVSADFTKLKAYFYMSDEDKAASPIGKELPVLSDIEMAAKGN